MKTSLLKPLFCLVLVIAYAIPAYAADLSIKVERHVDINQPADVTITSPDAAMQRGMLVATYRPGSAVPLTQQQPVPAMAAGESKIIKWKPTQPGIVNLTYKATPVDGEKAVSAKALVGVLFDGTPASGLAVFILAGLFLFGGCIFAFRLLTTEDA